MKKREGKSIWIHAVSVGEVLSLQKFVVRLKRMHPDWTIYFSSLTSDGIRIAYEKIKDADFIFHVPFDFRCVLKKYFKQLKPDILILTESEFWPNLIKVGAANTKGVFVINGRISERSFIIYKRYRFVFKKILSQVRMFLVQTEKHKSYLEKLGIKSEIVKVVGNMKADLCLTESNSEVGDKLKSEIQIKSDTIIFLAGSVHKGEDIEIVDSFMEAIKKRNNIQMIIAPRHLDRVADLENYTHNSGLSITRRTKIRSGQDWDILILDTLGELAHLYALCHFAFIGGSLIPRGGQNPLEPAFFGKAVFFGPHMDNFLEIATLMVESGAAEIVSGKKELFEMLTQIDMLKIDEMGRKAKTVLSSLEGATDKTLFEVDSIMNSY